MGALLGDFEETPVEKSPYQLLPLHKVEPNPDQPRQDFDEEQLQALAESISLHGVMQPLAVREVKGGYYQIIAGERRWRAARLAGLREIPAVIMEADDKTTMELALIENLQRQDLNPVEEALGYQSLIEDYGLTQEEAATRVGKSRPAVTNALRLLGLCPEVLDRVRKGELSAGHARAILPLPSPEAQIACAKKVIDGQLSVRQTEALVKALSRQPKEKPKSDQTDIALYLGELEKDLSGSLGRKVKIAHKGKKGKIELEYYGDEDLEVLLAALKSMRGGV